MIYQHGGKSALGELVWIHDKPRVELVLIDFLSGCPKCYS